MKNWIDSDDRLPVIPEDCYGISVLAVEFDPVYEELRPGKGSTVRQMSFTKKYGWTSMLLGMKTNSVSFTQCSFPITYWQYLPDPKQPKKDKKNE